MQFHNRKWAKHEDLDAKGPLFGGKLVAWIDEECAFHTTIQLENTRIVTKHISEINLRSLAKQGAVIEIGIDGLKFKNTSLTLKRETRNMLSRETIITIDNTPMVNLDADGKPKTQGKTTIEFVNDLL